MQQETGLAPRDTGLSQKVRPITIHPTFPGARDPGPGHTSQEASSVRDLSQVPSSFFSLGSPTSKMSSCMRSRLLKTVSSEGGGHTQSWNVARRSFKTRPASPLRARDSSLAGKGILLTLFQDVHTEASCGPSLQKTGGYENEAECSSL